MHVILILLWCAAGLIYGMKVAPGFTVGKPMPLRTKLEIFLCGPVIWLGFLYFKTAVERRERMFRPDEGDPTNPLTDAVEKLVGLVDKETKELLVKETDPSRWHRGLGRFIRNQFMLWDKEIGLPLRKACWLSLDKAEQDSLVEYWTEIDPDNISTYIGDNMHPDDASHVIIQAFINRLRLRGLS